MITIQGGTATSIWIIIFLLLPVYFLLNAHCFSNGIKAIRSILEATRQLVRISKITERFFQLLAIIASSIRQ